MPIINLCNATDEGARGTHYQAGYERYDRDTGGYNKFQGPSAYWTNLSHIGLCLKDFERNGYDDSDFMMIVWDPIAHEPKTICFASTRGWSYPCYASAEDATPEVRAEYKQYLEGLERVYDIQDRAKKAKELAAYRANLRRIAREFGVPYQRLLKARKMLGTDLTNRLLTLFNPRIRSGFKKSLREQVIAWFREATPKYARPLSARQMECVG